MSAAALSAGTLPSWVRTLDLAGAGAMLDAARPGMDRAAFAAAADAALAQADPDYRRTLVRVLWDKLLDHDAHHVTDAPFLRLFQSGSPGQRHDLFHLRWSLSHPWTLLAARSLLLPALAVRELPLAPRGAGVLPTAAFTALVDQHIDPEIGEASRRKTRGCVIGALIELGSLEKAPGPARGGVLYLPRRARPDPLAVAWAVADQMGREGRVELADDQAAREAHVAAVCALPPDAVRRALDAGGGVGLFTRSHLAGVPRVRLAATAQDPA